jgi:hypothetical protein
MTVPRAGGGGVFTEDCLDGILAEDTSAMEGAARERKRPNGLEKKGRRRETLQEVNGRGEE